MSTLSTITAIKTPEEIEKMRIAGRLAAQVLDFITPHVHVGVTTAQLDTLCHDYIVNIQQAIPACVGYRGYQHTVCTSLNHQVCHGIPSNKKLKSGDIINIDLVVQKDGYHGDTSKMFIVGKGSVLAQRLVKVTQECLYKGIKMVKPGQTVGDIGAIIQQHAEAHRFSVVRDFCGHGIGARMHEDPNILHYGRPGTGLTLQAGMIFTIEPMINAGKAETKILPDGWTAVTKDHSLSAQWEHTILVTATGYEVLTQRPEEAGIFS